MTFTRSMWKTNALTSTPSGVAFLVPGKGMPRLESKSIRGIPISTIYEPRLRKFSLVSDFYMSSPCCWVCEAGTCLRMFRKGAVPLV